MQISDYATLKEKGLINKVQKTNTDNPDALTYACYVKQYELDGAEVVQKPDEVTSFTNAELIARKEKVLSDAQAEVDAIDSFIGDAVNGTPA